MPTGSAGASSCCRWVRCSACGLATATAVRMHYARVNLRLNLNNVALLSPPMRVQFWCAQEKKEAKARARAEAQRRFADQQQRWEAAVADKKQQVAKLQAQVRGAGGW